MYEVEYGQMFRRVSDSNHNIARVLAHINHRRNALLCFLRRV